MNLGPLEEQPMLLTAQQSLQPIPGFPEPFLVNLSPILVAPLLPYSQHFHLLYNQKQSQFKIYSEKYSSPHIKTNEIQIEQSSRIIILLFLGNTCQAVRQT